MTNYKVAGILDVKAGYKNAAGNAIVYEDVPLANRFTQTQNPTDITFEGDNTSEKLFSSSQLDGTIGHDKLSDTLLEKIFGKRYYVNAQYANPISPDYQVVVDHVETIAGCRPPA